MPHEEVPPEAPPTAETPGANQDGSSTLPQVQETLKNTSDGSGNGGNGGNGEETDAESIPLGPLPVQHPTKALPNLTSITTSF